VYIVNPFTPSIPFCNNLFQDKMMVLVGLYALILHIKSNEVGTTLKHPKTINGNVKNLSEMMKMKDKGECHFYLLG
jgi:hypothetical protein